MSDPTSTMDANAGLRGLSPLAMVAQLWGSRHLCVALAHREAQARYRGSIGGPLWYLLQSIALLTIYTFVFGYVFQSRWPQLDNAPPGTFAASLFLGILMFNIFAEAVGRAPTIILSHASFVKNIVFPLDVLCIVSIAVALLNALVGFAVLLCAVLILGLPSSPAALALPVVLPPVILLTLGCAWFLAALGVYVRDVAQVVGLMVTAMMFFSPIFYPASALPEWARWMLLINPLSVPIESARALMFHGGAHIDWGALGISYGLGLATAYAGWLFFQVTRRGFADVI